MNNIRLDMATNDFEREVISNLKNVDDLIENGYEFWNWEEQKFEQEFECEVHINETFRQDWNLIHKVAEQEGAFIATIIDTAPLIIEEGVHYCNRYGYIVYKGEKIKEDYYI